MSWTRKTLQRISGRPLGRVSANALALLIAQVGARILNLVLIAQLTRGSGVEDLGRYLLGMTLEAIAFNNSVMQGVDPDESRKW